ncbi:MAG: RNA polymerase sigma factor [Pseudomonadota bacterium]
MRMRTEDEALAIAAGRGDRAAFAALVERSYDRLFRLCWRLTGSADRAEDLAQEVCVKLPRALRSYRGDAAFATWLHRIALNAARDAARRDGARNRAMAGYAAEAPLRAPDGEADEADAWLQAALARLKPDLAETAALVVGEGMSQADAAQVLGVSPGTVAWRMSEVKKALRAAAERERSAP